MDELIERLTTALGAEHVLTGAAVHERATSWIDPAPLSALAIARPRTTTEVATVLRLCHAARQPVVVQGGRTNLVRATHTTARDLVISLERMAAVGGDQMLAALIVLAFFGLPMLTLAYVFLRNKEVAP